MCAVTCLSVPRLVFLPAPIAQRGPRDASGWDSSLKVNEASGLRDPGVAARIAGIYGHAIGFNSRIEK